LKSPGRPYDIGGICNELSVFLYYLGLTIVNKSGKGEENQDDEKAQKYKVGYLHG
jgi:hypothetical protein